MLALNVNTCHCVDMKDISTHYPDYCGGNVAKKRYLYRGVVVEQSISGWVIWQDFVTQHHAQLRCTSLDIARKAIAALRA